MATHGAEEPPKEPVKIEGTKSHLIEVGEKGEYAVVVGFYKNGNPSFRYQRVPLDHRFTDAPEIYKMQVEYQHQLEALGTGRIGAEGDRPPERPQVCWQQVVRRMSYDRRRGVRKNAACSCDRNAGETHRSAAAARSGMSELPRDRLGAAKVFSVRNGLLTA